jgi:pilus assembly protein Flp/PilA
MYQFLHDESGATSIEYALIAMLVSLALIAGGTALGTALQPVFTTAASSIQP